MNSAKRRTLKPAIKRAKLESLTIFDVTESELDALERGSPESLFFNLGISTLSIALSFSVALATTKIESLKTYCFFVIVTVVGFISGLTFLLLWWKSRTSVRRVGQIIRARKVPEGVQENSSSDQNISPNT